MGGSERVPDNRGGIKDRAVEAGAHEMAARSASDAHGATVAAARAASHDRLERHEHPPPIPRADGVLVPAGTEIPLAEFLKLTKHPILLIWGDYIPKQLDKAYAGTPQESRRIFLEQYKLFAQAANKYGGNVRNVILPEIGISGNTHYAMADTNIAQVSRLVARWLKEKKLD